VPADRPLLTAARCRVSCKTRPMKCPVRGRQPGHRWTPAFAVGASASPVGSAVRHWTRSSAASPSCPGVLPRHSVDAPTQPRCIASPGLRFAIACQRRSVHNSPECCNARDAAAESVVNALAREGVTAGSSVVARSVEAMAKQYREVRSALDCRWLGGAAAARLPWGLGQAGPDPANRRGGQGQRHRPGWNAV
jgi:hypothetical protein